MNLPNKKYDLLVIDPPWNVKKLTHKARPNQIKFDYPTMSIDEIKAIDLQSVANHSFLYVFKQKILNILKNLTNFSK